MSDTENPQEGEKSAMRTLSGPATLLISLVILLAAGLLIFWIYSTEPQAQRTGATRETAMLVDVQEVERGDYAPQILGLGRVEAAQDIILSPRVSGRVLAISENFIPGGFVEAGEQLLQIDAADYRNTVRQRQSELRRARSDLDIELGRRDVAQQEYALLDETLSGENQALVLREPQLDAARAAVQSAEAALDQAQLELRRTRIEAPFNAQVLRRNANVGSQVAPGQDLGRLIGIDEYWVIVTVPVSKLERIAFPAQGAGGAPVRVRNRAAWPEGAWREGRVSRLIGALDDETRLARVLVTVKDPLALEKGRRGPRMIVGSVVQARIQGELLKEVVRIDRDYLRKDDTAWVMQDGKLAIRDLQVVFRDSRHAYIAAGLNTGDRLVTSNLATVAEGSALRTQARGSGGTEPSSARGDE